MKMDKDYDAEPVKFCANCYSLKIGYEPLVDMEYCMDCGSSELHEANIYQWENLYATKYGHKYIRRTKSTRSPYASLSEEEHRALLYNSSALPEIIKRLYPKFPTGLNRGEAVMLLYNSLKKDGRIDELCAALATAPSDNKDITT